MAVDDVARAIGQVRSYLREYTLPNSRKRPNLSAPANRSEMSTRYLVIDPVLSSLGWDPLEPTLSWLEYRIREEGGSRPVDYSLLASDGSPLVLVEAKRLQISSRDFPCPLGWGRDMRKLWRRDWMDGRGQLRDYMESIDTATAGILTNGQEWLLVQRVMDRLGGRLRSRLRWDELPICLSSRRRVGTIARELHERLAREIHVP